MADDDEQGNAVGYYGRQLIGLVADALVVGYRDPASPANCLQPLLVRGVGGEVIIMPLYVKAGSRENGRELLAEVAIGKEDKTQAARS